MITKYAISKMPQSAEQAKIQNTLHHFICWMSTIPPLTVHEVFEFSQQETDFWPSHQFRSDLAASKCPFIIMFVGNGRAGKSTRLNQVVAHELKADSPFESCNGAEPVTMKFQYVGPFKFQHLSQIHGVDLQLESNPDIFLIDCEGLHSLGKTTAVLKQATFALSQMVSMTVLVMKEQVNHENIENVRSLFVLSHAFSRQLPGFSIGTTIMMREVGVRYPKGKKLDLDDKNALRQESDVKQRTNILKILNDNHVTFSEADFLVLGQPGIDENDLYWKSIEDFLHFTVSIAVKRGNVSGQSLLQLFEEAKPSIMQVTDFSNPSIPFDRIMQNITGRYLKQASSAAIEGGKKDVQEWLTQLKSLNLRGGLDSHVVGDKIVKWTHVFEEKAEQLFPQLLAYSSEQTEKYRELIKNSIEMSSNQLFVERSIAVVVPEIQNEIFEGIKQDIAKEMNAIPVEELGGFSFTTLSLRHEGQGESRFHQSVLKIHLEIPKSAEFSKFIGELRANISEHVKDVETAKRKQYAAYVQGEIEKEKAAREAKFQEDLKKMEKEEAEKRRHLQEERDAAERRLKEEEMKREMELKQKQELMQQQMEQQRQQSQAMIEMQERASRERDQMFQQMMDNRREADARATAQRQEEMRIQAERDKSLSAQIVQLASRPPQVIEVGGGGSCNVF
jgi:flagellar biosynthesis GTPase FlhF